LLLSLLPLMLQTSTGLPLIKLVGTGDGAVADLRMRRARDGGEVLQPCRQSVQRKRNGKLLWRERWCCLGEPWRRQLHVHVNRSTCGLVVGCAFIPSSFLFSFFFSIFFSPGWMSSLFLRWAWRRRLTSPYDHLGD
jgi:hypothetical protein